MKANRAARWPVVLLLALLGGAALACSLSAATASPTTTLTPAAGGTGSPSATGAATAPTDAAPTLAWSGQVVVTQSLTFGDGPFNLSDPRLGLASLTSYTAALTTTFAGTVGGQPVQWSRTYVMLAETAPAARQLTIQTTGSVSGTGAVYLAELNGADYEQRGQGYCSASAVQPGQSLSDQFEPASFLHSVIGATEAGSASVNGAAARHYTFDERAMGQQGLTQSTGELWVAAEGGYLVKYQLTTKGGADYFGEGIIGILTEDYELTGAGQPVTIQLPAGCPAGMLDVPLLPGAANVVKLPGSTSYDTPTPLAAAITFYQKQLPTLGWQIADAGDIGDTEATLDFQKGGEQMTVSLTTAANVTSVNIFVNHAEP